MHLHDLANQLRGPGACDPALGGDTEIGYELARGAHPTHGALDAVARMNEAQV